MTNISESDFRIQSPTYPLINDNNTQWHDEKIIYRCNFDRDVEISYKRWFTCAAGSALVALFPYLLPCAPFAILEYWNIKDKVYSKSCFITEQHLVYREEPHLTLLRMDCCYKTGLVEQILPLHKIQEVQITYPGKGPIERYYPVTKVKIETASNSMNSQGKVTPELVLTGLTDPQGFRDALLKQLKVIQHQGGGQQQLGLRLHNDEHIKLLKDIKDDVHKISKALESKK